MNHRRSADGKADHAHPVGAWRSANLLVDHILEGRALDQRDAVGRIRTAAGIQLDLHTIQCADEGLADADGIVIDLQRLQPQGEQHGDVLVIPL